MQSEAVMKAAGCQIVCMGSFSSRKQGKQEKQRRRVREADDKFASLNERSQRVKIAIFPMLLSSCELE